MLESFSDAAAAVVAAARREAGRLGHDRVGTEHMVLGLLGGVNDGAATALREAGATLEAARHKAAEVTTATGEVPPQELPYTPRVQRACERAARFARQAREPRVETDHVLLGVLDVEGLGCQVLRGLGVDVAHLRDVVGRRRAGPDTGAEPAPSAVFGPPPPRCSACGAALDETLAARVLHAKRETGVARRVLVVYCSACGCALGVVPPSSSEPEPLS